MLERDKAALDVRGQQALPADNSIGQRAAGQGTTHAQGDHRGGSSTMAGRLGTLVYLISYTLLELFNNNNNIK